MTMKYQTGSVIYPRQCLVKLSADQRASLAKDGRVSLRFPVAWPDPNRTPVFAEAYADPGGTNIWGPGPYLKVPNYAKDPANPGDRLVNRVFCPWGYPSDRLRISRKGTYLEIEAVGLQQAREAAWEWVLTLKPWHPPAAPQTGLRMLGLRKRSIRQPGKPGSSG